MRAPSSRVRVLNAHEVFSQGTHVVYWMTSARRPLYNFALQHALNYAREFEVPLVVFEALRVGYPWASARLHSFILQGMASHARYFAGTKATYFPYLERQAGEGAGLLAALAQGACVVVADDSPAFFFPHMLKAASKKLATRLEAVDTLGLLPMCEAGGRTFVTAYSFRRFLQKKLPGELVRLPIEEPLRSVDLHVFKLPRAISQRWPRLTTRELSKPEKLLEELPIDHSVTAVHGTEGGFDAGRRVLAEFTQHGIARYADRNHPDDDASSGLSPWLHFGHVGAHQVIAALKETQHWNGLPNGATRNGTRTGFWGLSEPVEAFLDELVTWRELSINTCATQPRYDHYDSLPDWSRRTLEAHAQDAREPVYSLAQLEAAKTYDEIWNAAQRQLVREGRLHNYMRMLWGKKILEWSSSPRVALKRMVHLNNKYALDGRDPNSYSGIFWVLGRYDRPWAPERAVYGTVRYMSSQAALRKLRLKDYLARYSEDVLSAS